MKSEEEPVVHKYRQVSDEEDTAKVDNGDIEKGEEEPKLMFILIDS